MRVYKCRTPGWSYGSLIVGASCARGCPALSGVLMWGLLLGVDYIGRRAPNVVAGLEVIHMQQLRKKWNVLDGEIGSVPYVVHR